MPEMGSAIQVLLNICAATIGAGALFLLITGISRRETSRIWTAIAFAAVLPLMLWFANGGARTLSEQLFGFKNPQNQPTATTPTTPSSAPSQPPESPRPSVPAEASRPVDWSWLPGLVAVVAVIIAAVVVLWLIFGVIIPRSKKAAQKARLAREAVKRSERIITGKLSLATKLYQRLMLEQAAYETDLAKQIDFPIMVDTTEPAVSAYVKAMKNSTLIFDTLPEDPGLEEVNALAAAVADFETTFHAAETYAQRQKWAKISVQEQKILKEMRRTLALAENRGATEAERQLAYTRLAKLLETSTVITITEKVRQALTPWVPRLAIEARDNLDPQTQPSLSRQP